MSTHGDGPDERPARRTAALVQRVAAYGIARQEGAVLLVRSASFSDFPGAWSLPGGGVDRGETLHDALRRELNEEVTLDIEPGELVTVSESIAPDGSRHMVQCCFTATILKGEVALGIDERVVEARFVTAAELADLEVHPPLNEELIDGIQNGFQSCTSYIANRWLVQETE